MATRKVTAASMIMCGGRLPTTYGVYRCTLHYGLKNKPDYLSFRKAKRVAIVQHEPSHSVLFPWELAKMYYDMAKPFATPEWPPFSFGYEPEQESAT
jgi:hypothetical protein